MSRRSGDGSRHLLTTAGLRRITRSMQGQARRGRPGVGGIHPHVHEAVRRRPRRHRGRRRRLAHHRPAAGAPTARRSTLARPARAPSGTGTAQPQTTTWPTLVDHRVARRWATGRRVGRARLRRGIHRAISGPACVPSWVRTHIGAQHCMTAKSARPVSISSDAQSLPFGATRRRLDRILGCALIGGYSRG